VPASLSWKRSTRRPDCAARVTSADDDALRTPATCASPHVREERAAGDSVGRVEWLTFVDLGTVMLAHRGGRAGDRHVTA